jgi:hypothetical protein
MSPNKLDALADLLAKTGGDAGRIELVKSAQRFRRSWVELAKGLCDLRRTRRYEAWGYSDFYDYCAKELTLRRPTVDKLTISFSTLKKHAPDILERDGVAQPIPNYQAIDYFGKAVGDYGDDAAELAKAGKKAVNFVVPRSESEVSELRSAIFDEGASVTELHRRFDERFFPKPKAERELEVLRKVSSAAKRLQEALEEVPDLPELQQASLNKQLTRLLENLEEKMEPLRLKAERAAKRAARLEA